MHANSPTDRRQAALEATGLLDAAPSETLERLTRLVRRLLGVPVALVSFIERDRQYFAAASGVAEPYATTRETPLSHSFCQYVVNSGSTLSLTDAREDERYRDNLAIPDFGLVAYLGVPLVCADGQVLGSFCAIDRVARQWSADDVATMDDLAHAVMAEITARTQARSHLIASEHYSDLLDTTTELVCSLDEHGRITYVNRAWCATLGYSADEAIGMPALTAVSPGDLRHYMDVSRALREHGVVEDVEIEMLSKSGRRVVGRGRATAVRTSDGTNRILSSHAIYRDVTLERRAEQQKRVLLEVTQQLATANDISSALTRTLQLIGTEAGWEYAELWLPPEHPGWTKGTARTMRVRLGPVWFVPGDARLVWFREQHARVTFGPGEGLAGRVVQTRKALVVRDLTAAPELGRADALRDAGLQAAQAVPILVDGEVFAVFAFYARSAESVEQSGQELVEAVASQVGTVLRRAIAESALRESEQRLSVIYHNVSEFLLFARVERNLLGRVSGYRCISVNEVRVPAGFRDGERLEGQVLDSMADPAMRTMLRQHWDAAVATREPQRYEISVEQIIGGATRMVDTETTLTPVLDADGVCTHVLSSTRDVTAGRAAEAARREADGAFRKMLETLRAIAVILDVTGRVTFVNDSLLTMTGWTRDEALGSDWFERFVPQGDGLRRLFLGLMRGDDSIPHYENPLLTRSGRQRLIVWDNTTLYDAAGHIVGTASIGHDVTEQRQMERQLADLSERDDLTGLLNRRGFLQRVDYGMRSAVRARRRDTLLFIDLDKFKPINDTFGHAEGDNALRAVATLLKATIRDTDFAGRIGGDEFAVYAVDAGDRDGGMPLTERLQAALVAHNRHATERGRPYEISFTVGSTHVLPDDSQATLLARADECLYSFKRARQR